MNETFRVMEESTMLCPKCGKQVSDGSRFCVHCGSVLSGGSPAGSGAVPQGGAQPPAPGVGKKKPKTGLIAGLIAGCAALVVLAVVLVTSAFASPRQQTEEAFTKTAAAFSQAGSRLEQPGLAQLLKSAGDRAFSQHYSLVLDSISPELSGGYDLSALSGLGLYYSGGYDQGGRTMAATLTARLSDMDLATLRLQVEDDILTLDSPEFTGDSALGLNTRTLGADLVRLGVEDSTGELQNLSFNLFDLAQALVPAGDGDQNGTAFREACLNLWEQAEVEKAGNETIQVNSYTVDARHFVLTFPAWALQDWLEALRQILESADTTLQARALLEALGFSPDYIDSALAETDPVGTYGEAFDALMQAAEKDLNLDVYTDGGYLAAVEYSREIDGELDKLGLYLGGGEEYVDDLSLVLTADGTEVLRLASSGSHALRDGRLTDTTELVVNDGGSVTRITSTLRYEPEAQSDNFSWALDLNGMAGLAASGQLTAGKDSLEADLDDISLTAGGARLMGLRAAWGIGPYAKPDFTLSAPALLADMSQEDLQRMYYDVAMNAINWANRMAEELPEGLVDLLLEL